MVLDRPRQDQGGGVRADGRAEAFDDATQLAIRDQERAGIDVICDGEMRRFFFVQTFYGKMEGLETLEPCGRRVSTRTTACPATGPRERSPCPRASARGRVQVPQDQTDKPVKATCPDR